MQFLNMSHDYVLRQVVNLADKQYELASGRTIRFEFVEDKTAEITHLRIGTNDSGRNYTRGVGRQLAWTWTPVHEANVVFGSIKNVTDTQLQTIALHLELLSTSGQSTSTVRRFVELRHLVSTRTVSTQSCAF